MIDNNDGAAAGCYLGATRMPAAAKKAGAAGRVYEGLLVRSAERPAPRRPVEPADQPGTCTPASNILTPEIREIVLTVTVSAKHGETTMFLVEVKAGRRLPDEEPHRR